MPINPKKLAAFAQQQKKEDGPMKKAPPFGKKGKGHGRGGKNGDDQHHDEGGHEHDEAGEDIDVEAIGERVQNGKGDKKLMKLAHGVTDETNPPESITDEAKWEKAKEAVEPHWDDYDEPYAVVMHVYEQMGGEFKGEGGKGGRRDDDDHEDEERDE